MYLDDWMIDLSGRPYHQSLLCLLECSAFGKKLRSGRPKAGKMTEGFTTPSYSERLSSLICSHCCDERSVGSFLAFAARFRFYPLSLSCICLLVFNRTILLLLEELCLALPDQFKVIQLRLILLLL